MTCRKTLVCIIIIFFNYLTSNLIFIYKDYYEKTNGCGSYCATNAPMTSTDQTTIMSCQDNGQIANLNVTLPKVGINNKKLTLNQAVSASGARYVNSPDP